DRRVDLRTEGEGPPRAPRADGYALPRDGDVDRPHHVYGTCDDHGERHARETYRRHVIGHRTGRPFPSRANWNEAKRTVDVHELSAEAHRKERGLQRDAAEEERRRDHGDLVRADGGRARELSGRERPDRVQDRPSEPSDVEPRPENRCRSDELEPTQVMIDGRREEDR